MRRLIFRAAAMSVLFGSSIASAQYPSIGGPRANSAFRPVTGIRQVQAQAVSPVYPAKPGRPQAVQPVASSFVVKPSSTPVKVLKPLTGLANLKPITIKPPLSNLPGKVQTNPIKIPKPIVAVSPNPPGVQLSKPVEVKPMLSRLATQGAQPTVKPVILPGSIGELTIGKGVVPQPVKLSSFVPNKRNKLGLLGTNALSGQTLSAADRLRLTSLMGNKALPKFDQAAIAKMLQSDWQNKQKHLHLLLQSSIHLGHLTVPLHSLCKPLDCLPPCPPSSPPEDPQIDPDQTTPPDSPSNPAENDLEPPLPPNGGNDSETMPPAETEYGLKITFLAEGGAAKLAGLGEGDILLTIGSKRVQSFDEMVAIVTQAEGEIEIIYAKAKTLELQSIAVTPTRGKLGVAVDPIPIATE